MEQETKSIIRSLVASTPLRSTIRTVLRDYRDTVGLELPYKQLGFDNPEQYLRSIPDVVQINGRGLNAEVLQVHSKKLEHINALVSKQRVSKKMVKPVPRSRIVPPSAAFHAPAFFYDRNWRLPLPNVVERRQQPFGKQQQQHRRNFPPRSPVVLPRSPPHGTVPRLEQPSLKTAGEAYGEISPFVKKYMQHKQEVFSTEGEDETFYDEVEDRVPEEVKNNLRNLVGDHPQGIWCCDLPKLYMSRYFTNLDYRAYKFRTLNEMCLYLASIFHYIRPNKADFKLYDKRRPMPRDLSVNDVVRHEGTTTVIADDLGIPDIERLAVSDEPSDVVHFLEDIPRQWLAKEQVVGSYIDVSVAEIYDPSKFWFIIYKDKLDAMMDEMQMYYMENKRSLEIPRNKLKEGLYCCAIFMSEYHRAIVIAATTTQDQIKVYFIDYGTVARVPVKGICYLHQKFTALPQQAIRGRLAGVYPTSAQLQWSREIASRFFNLVAQKELVGRIEKINLQKQLVHLVLIEPKGSKEQDIYVNQLLIDEGHAIASPEEQKEAEVNKYAVPIVRHLHFYPTFEELEQGLVPSAPEMINLLSSGCSLELIYPQYFRRCYYKHELQKLRSEEMSSHSESPPSSEDVESVEEKNSDAGGSNVTEEEVNFTEASIQDKGGTTTTNDGAGREAQAAAVEGCPLAPVVRRPPPGFEGVTPNINVQQNIPPIPNCGYPAATFQPVIQQNYFYHPFSMTPCGYIPQLAYGQYYPHPLNFSPYQVVSQYLHQLNSSVAGGGGEVGTTQSSEDSDVVTATIEINERYKGRTARKEPVQKSVIDHDVAVQDNDDVCLLDTNEVELESVLCQHGTEIDRKFAGTNALEKFLTTDKDDDTEKPKQISTYNNNVTMKVIGGKTMAVVKWEEKEHVVFDEVVRLYIGGKLELSKVKLLLARRNIFVKDINVNQLGEGFKDEFQRNNLITETRFGSFVHLIELQQFVRAFVPGADM